MPHDNHTTDTSILELKAHDRDWYIKASEHWVDPLGLPVVQELQLDDGRTLNIIREDLHETGLKARWADLLLKSTTTDTIVYVQPRVGYAGISLAKLCKKYNKRVVLFCPAAKEASDHQRIAGSLGAELRFVRIAAMPVLNVYAKKWAEDNGHTFIPLGLRHPLITAAGVNYALRVVEMLGQPKQIWLATSTGVLARSFMVAYEDRCDYRLVAVARNLKDGERGPSTVYSHPFDFSRAAKDLPPYPTISTYDAKLWSYVKEFAHDGAFIMNVAAEQKVPEFEVKGTNKEWHDFSDLAKG